MTHPFGTPLLLADTTSRGGPPEPALGELLAELSAAGIQVDVVRISTVEAGDAARAAVAEGRRYLVASGGDDTISAVAGALADGAPDDLVVGVAPLGTSCDFARTFGLDRRPAVLAKHLASDAVMDLDVGVVEYVAPDGSPGRRQFVNVAQAGYGAGLARRQRRWRALGRVGTLLGAWAAIRAVPRQEATVAVAHTTRTLPLVSLVVANGQFYADGSKVAPRALPDDGSLNVQVYTGDRSQVFLLTSRIFRGEHLPDPQIVEYQSPTVELDAPVAVPVEADGTWLGRTPARFSLLPAALRLKI